MIKSIVLYTLIVLVLGSQLLYIDFTTFREIRPAIEAGLYCFIFLALIASFLIAPPKLQINQFEFLVLFLFGYQVVSIILRDGLVMQILFQKVFIVLLYWALKTQFAKRFDRALLVRIAIITLSLQILAVAVYCIGGGSLTSFYSPNISIFSIVLACQCALILPVLIAIIKSRCPKYRMKGSLLALLLIAGVVIILLTGGRSGLVGLLAAGGFLLLVQYRGRYKKLLVGAVTATFLLTIIVATLGFKQDSSSGRLLIYKVSGRMLSRNWLVGIGEGAYSKEYNLAQAKYFSSADINSKEAMLADNVYYGFNDLFQFLTENGICGGLLLGLALLILTCHVIQLRQCNQLTSALPFVMVITCAVGASLFSYPFHHFPVELVTIASIAYLNTIPGMKEYTLERPIQYKIIPPIAIGVSITLFLIAGNQFIGHLRIAKAKQLAEIGQKAKSNEIFEAALQHVSDGKALLYYARELYYTGDLRKAEVVMNKTKEVYSSLEVYRLSGDINQELSHFSAAEQDFKTSLYIAPNRMVSRDRLIGFYLASGDSTKAFEWAISVTQMPVKVPSVKADRIKKEAAAILRTFRK